MRLVEFWVGDLIYVYVVDYELKSIINGVYTLGNGKLFFPNLKKLKIAS